MNQRCNLRHLRHRQSHEAEALRLFGSHLRPATPRQPNRAKRGRAVPRATKEATGKAPLRKKLPKAAPADLPVFCLWALEA
jgi:hypothetical protein